MNRKKLPPPIEEGRGRRTLRRRKYRNTIILATVLFKHLLLLCSEKLNCFKIKIGPCVRLSTCSLPARLQVVPQGALLPGPDTCFLTVSYLPLKRHPLLDSCPLQAGLGVRTLVPKPGGHIFIRMPHTSL